jgi:glycosyltransferase involved in cell wall biosynthesis
MKILQVHNFYQQPGGEDVVVRQESEMLRAHGHQVVSYTRHNSEIESYRTWERLTLPLRSVWAWDSYRGLRDVLERQRPDVAHFHNTFPLVSPHGYHACRDARVPVVQTLHNYRLLCPAATSYRDGAVCDDCSRHSLLRGVVHACYRESRLATATVALMLATHRLARTWTNLVDVYIALTGFARDRFLAAGLGADRIRVVPNCVQPDPGASQGDRGYALFIGRLTEEKGLACLLDAWSMLDQSIPLRILGDGPLRADLESRAARLPPGRVLLEGKVDRERAIETLKAARMLVLPSLWYEGFPVSAAEALACGVPVVASRLGGLSEIVPDGICGRLFAAGDARDLAAVVGRLWSDRESLGQMGRQARQRYLEHYAAERVYQKLMGIYREVVSR